MIRALIGRLARAATPNYDLRDSGDDIWVAEGPDWWRMLTDPGASPMPRTTRAEIDRCYGPVVKESHAFRRKVGNA